MSDAYHANFRVPPADQRARGVPGDYRRAAVECDRDWNGTLPGSVGAFEGYLASLPPVIGLGFGPYGEWSAEVDTLIGQAAEIGSACPEDGRGTRRSASFTSPYCPSFLVSFLFFSCLFSFSFWNSYIFIEKKVPEKILLSESQIIPESWRQKKIHRHRPF